MPLPSESRKIRLPRIGKISTGIESPTRDGKSTRPENVPYFLVSPTKAANSEDACKAFAEVYGDKPARLDVMFPSNSIEDCIESALRSYGAGAGLKCISRDGELAVNLETGEQVPCTWADPEDPCPVYAAGNCKEVHIVSLLLPKVRGIGVWQYDTGSPNIAVDIRGALMMAKLFGPISSQRFVLERQEVEKITRDTQGKQIKRRVWISVLRQMEESPDALMARITKMKALPAASAAGSEPADLSKPTLLYPEAEEESVPGAAAPSEQGDEGQTAPDDESPGLLPIEPEQIEELRGLAKGSGLTPAKAQQYLQEAFGCTKVSQLNQDQYHKAVAQLQAAKA